VRAAIFALSLACGGAFVAVHATAGAESPPKRILLDIGDADTVLDGEVLRRTLEADVAVPVTLGTDRESPVIVLRRRGDRTVGIVVRRGPGEEVERTIALPKDKALAGETAALAASNLLRDEAREILSALTPKEPPRTVEQPTVDAGPSTAPASTEVAKRSPCLEGTTIPIGADFAPYMGTSSVYPNRVRWVSANILGGYARGLRAFEFAAGVNLESSFMCGVQFAGLSNIVLGPMHGAQFAPVNVAAGDAEGLQSGIGNLAADSLSGAQVGTANLTVGALKGAQIGAFNFALTSLGGAQIGAINVTNGEVHGVQIGAINYADRAEAPIGAVSIVRHGKTSVDAWGTESGLAMATVHHGGTIVHNLYGVGYRLGQDARWSLALGIGVHVPLAARLDLDIDFVYHMLEKGNHLSGDTHLAVLQPSFTYAVAPPFGIFVAPTFNVLASNEGDDIAPPWGSFQLDASGPTVIHAWPGLSLGVRAEL
jgi:hypothetical protein